MGFIFDRTRSTEDRLIFIDFDSKAILDVTLEGTNITSTHISDKRSDSGYDFLDANVSGEEINTWDTTKWIDWHVGYMTGITCDEFATNMSKALHSFASNNALPLNTRENYIAAIEAYANSTNLYNLQQQIIIGGV